MDKDTVRHAVKSNWEQDKEEEWEWTVYWGHVQEVDTDSGSPHPATARDPAKPYARMKRRERKERHKARTLK